MKAEKRFLMAIAGLMAICMTVLSAGAVNVSEQQFVFNYDGKEIVVYGDVDERKAQSIVASMNGEEAISTLGLTCVLFGHNIVLTAITAITHKYYPTAPKCLKDTYNLTYCTRCDYTVWTLISQIRIHCCA